jgi:hypothetical protein
MGKASTSEAITGGLWVIRQARGKQLHAAAQELALVSQGQAGVTIYQPYAEPYQPQTQVRLVSNYPQIYRNKSLLSHLTRGVVYKALEALPDLCHPTDLTTTSGILDDTEVVAGSRLIRVGFDKASTAKIQDQHDQIGQTLMRLAVEAGVYAPPLEWDPIIPDVVLALVGPDTPDEVFQTLRQTAEGFDPMALQVRRTKILPRLDRSMPA